ncbi:trichohyalin-like [Rhopilema esculentum]|uniref:trichohyalin-like n=1 Tax=Rhopilema esculentum TaxID=499914 RepID=UPI0031D14D3A
MATTEISREGSKKVKDVCQDFMTREDEALAQRLQDEEFQTHYLKNREERGTARVDVKAAKNAYLEEVKQAGLLREYEYQRLAADDAWLASELQQRLDEEENLESQQRSVNEMQDEEYAMFLQEREKEKVKRERARRLRNRIERERKELSRIERERGGEAEEGPSTKEYGFPHSGSRKAHSTASAEGDAPVQRVSIKKDDETWSDLRSYEVEDEHAAGEKNRQQELEDEELARRLQQREQEKLRKLMEERDRRLALKMQKQETEEYRRERAERQARKASSIREQSADATSAEDQESRSETQREKRRENSDHHDHHLQKNDKCDPSLHYYERPVYNVEVASTKNSKNGSTSQKDSNLESRQKVNLGASKTKHEPVYEVIDPEIILAESGTEPNKITQRDCNENRRLPDKLEDERIQGHGTPSQRNSFKSKDRTSQVASRVRDEGPGEEIGNQRFSNVAASIDPTFRGDVKEEAPGADDRIWVIGDSGIRVSSNSKPEPLIQNTRRKQSKDKSAKDKEKCKQQ